MEKSLAEYDNVTINAGRRGMMLIMKPEDIVRAAKATVEELADGEIAVKNGELTRSRSGTVICAGS